jgi:hypothetical protein
LSRSSKEVHLLGPSPSGGTVVVVVNKHAA